MFFLTLSDRGGAQVAGEDYALYCVGSVVASTYRWLKDGLPLAETSYTLSFSPLRDSDSGVYTCGVTINSFAITSPAVVITVVGKSEEHNFHYDLYLFNRGEINCVLIRVSDS